MKPTPIRPVSVARGPDYSVAAVVVATILSAAFLLNAQLNRQAQREMLQIQAAILLSR